ncbi:hypothetical protein PR202_ga10279 [Eleusine coracana subsp. coracana]|uniref:Uncharacterized protein n=1 Tax=Eleusine coracana subsp. coracana TaxID=191504 RepID=A0AAV5C686_ELECO|nr:hypothetical protein PR202_ga10279 [Eleusine coracana subsp. coracana]
MCSMFADIKITSGGVISSLCKWRWPYEQVTEIPQTSPLSEHLSTHDVILSVDGLKLTRTDEWMKMLDQGTTMKISGPEFLEGSQRYVGTSSGKGYCVPNSWMDASKNLWQINDKLSCPDELIAFEKMICNGSNIFSEKIGRDSDQEEVEGKYCLIVKDVVKLRKCGNGWRRIENDESSCACFQTSGLSISIMDTTIIIISTILSTAFHEFGHAIAAARIFLSFQRSGFIVQESGIMLRSQKSHKHLLCQKHLSTHDVILSVDGLKLTRTDEWMKMLDQGTTMKISGPEFLEGSQRYVGTSSGKGYCVPNSWMDASKNLWQINDKLSCPDETDCL